MTAEQDGRVLADWWRDQAQEEINKTIPKAVEYGAGDLAEIGRTMGRLMGRDKLTEQEATEIGIFFYLVGKVARWEQAIHEGRQIGLDTLFDAKVYLGMAIRTRQVGGWPWATETDAAQLGLTESEATALADRYFEGGTDCGNLARVSYAVRSCTLPAGHDVQVHTDGTHSWIDTPKPREGF